MGPSEPYRGAISLGGSKYATPQHSSMHSAFPSAALLTKPAANGSTALATKDQIETDSGNGITNPDAQLSIAQNEALRDEVGKHSAKLKRSMSTIDNTRRLLTLLRESVTKGSPDSADANLKAVDILWQELEQLFDAACEANAALPEFLDKQKDNMSLYHGSMLNEAFRTTQEELNLQHHKVNVQHSLILEHQEAFTDYKAKIEPKLKEVTELQERASRLALEKGLLRTELDIAQQMLSQVQAIKEDEAKELEGLQEEVRVLLSSNKELVVQSDTLHATINELQDKSCAAEQKDIADFKKEIERITEECTKEQQKATALDSLVKGLRAGETEFKRECERLKSELSTANQKYKSQSAEFSKVFTDLIEQTKKVNNLKTEVERLQKQNSDLDGKLAKLDQLQADNCDAHREKASLQAQLDRTNAELADLREQLACSVQEVKTGKDKLEKATREAEDLETENNELVAKQAEHDKIATTLVTVQDEKAKLLCSLQELQSKPAVSNDANSLTMEVESLEARLREMEKTRDEMEKDLASWQDFATKSYTQYKEMLPVYKEASQIRQENEQLKAKLGANGAGEGDAAHWRKKYDDLLASFE